MTYLSARRRRELALLPAIVYGIAWQLLSDGNQDKAKPGTNPDFRDRILERLTNAMIEPLQGLPRDEQIRTLGRLRPLRLWLLEPWEHHTDLVQVVIAVHELMRLLVETGYLELIPGSDFALAWDELAEAILRGEGNAERFDRLEAIGRATGLALLARLQSKGLFRAPVLLELAEAA